MIKPHLKTTLFKVYFVLGTKFHYKSITILASLKTIIFYILKLYFNPVALNWGGGNYPFRVMSDLWEGNFKLIGPLGKIVNFQTWFCISVFSAMIYIKTGLRTKLKIKNDFRDVLSITECRMPYKYFCNKSLVILC